VSKELTPASATRLRLARRWSLMLYSLAVLLVALAIWGVLDPGGFVVVATLFAHPFLLGVPALALVSVACWVGPGPAWVRATGLMVGALVAFGYGWFGGVNLMSASPQHQIVGTRAADGGLELRVLEGAQVVDTVWELRVRRTAGLLSQEWSAGCLNGDKPDDAFVAVRWTGPASVAVAVADGRVLRVQLDPATGRPLRRVVTGAGC
jgi:hypothetical protein